MSMFSEYLQSTSWLMWFGLTSAVLSTFAYLPYIIDTIARRTQPQRASWLIWSVLSGIAFFSQLYEGANLSLWFAGVQASGTMVVFILSIGQGVGGFLKKTDCLVLAAAAIGLLLWYLTESAAYALGITISISLLGGSVTVLKAYKDPDSETMQTWFLSMIASALALFSVGHIDWVLMAYPLYLLVLNTAIVVAMIAGRSKSATLTPLFDGAQS